jgi:hypothetical protein
MALAGCADRGPTAPAYGYEAASADTRPRTVRVVKVWDTLEDAVTTYRDQRVSHLVEVEILAGPPGPTVWPWDHYAKDRAQPPAVGTEVVAAPAEWVGASIRQRMIR